MKKYVQKPLVFENPGKGKDKVIIIQLIFCFMSIFFPHVHIQAARLTLTWIYYLLVNCGPRSRKTSINHTSCPLVSASKIYHKWLMELKGRSLSLKRNIVCH